MVGSLRVSESIVIASDLGHSEVCYLGYVILAKQNILRFQISMHNPVCMNWI